MMALRGILGSLGELFQFFLTQKLWWLIPMLVLLLAFTALIVLSSASGFGPFIYTLF